MAWRAATRVGLVRGREAGGTLMDDAATSRAGGRLAFGWGPLDAHLGGGLLPGTLTVIAGATGAGKTQLGLAWLDAGRGAEGRRGAIVDLTSRGDSQFQEGYAARRHGWTIAEFEPRGWRPRRRGTPRAPGARSTGRSPTWAGTSPGRTSTRRAGTPGSRT
jgi:hypothetical protein